MPDDRQGSMLFEFHMYLPQ